MITASKNTFNVHTGAEGFLALDDFVEADIQHFTIICISVFSVVYTPKCLNVLLWL